MHEAAPIATDHKARFVAVLIVGNHGGVRMGGRRRRERRRKEMTAGGGGEERKAERGMTGKQAIAHGHRPT